MPGPLLWLVKAQFGIALSKSHLRVLLAGDQQAAVPIVGKTSAHLVASKVSIIGFGKELNQVILFIPNKLAASVLVLNQTLAVAIAFEHLHFPLSPAHPQLESIPSAQLDVHVHGLLPDLMLHPVT